MVNVELSAHITNEHFVEFKKAILNEMPRDIHFSYSCVDGPDEGVYQIVKSRLRSLFLHESNYSLLFGIDHMLYLTVFAGEKITLKLDIRHCTPYGHLDFEKVDKLWNSILRKLIALQVKL